VGSGSAKIKALSRPISSRRETSTPPGEILQRFFDNYSQVVHVGILRGRHQPQISRQRPAPQAFDCLIAVAKVSLQSMIIAILLIIVPGFAWERVASGRKSILSITLFFLLPLMVLTSIGEGYGLVRYGKEQATFKFTKQFNKLTPSKAAAFEVLQIAGSFAVIFACAAIVRMFGDTFHSRQTYLQAFTALAYGLAPLFLLRLANIFPWLYPWIPWLVGIALSVGALYIGIPRIMQPDPPHAFGLYVMTSLVLVAATGLLQIITSGYLMGKVKVLNDVIETLAGIMPLK
jgi:hypothetical protein